MNTEIPIIDYDDLIDHRIDPKRKVLSNYFVDPLAIYAILDEEKETLTMPYLDDANLIWFNYIISKVRDEYNIHYHNLAPLAHIAISSIINSDIRMLPILEKGQYIVPPGKRYLEHVNDVIDKYSGYILNKNAEESHNSRTIFRHTHRSTPENIMIRVIIDLITIYGVDITSFIAKAMELSYNYVDDYFDNRYRMTTLGTAIALHGLTSSKIDYIYDYFEDNDMEYPISFDGSTIDIAIRDVRREFLKEQKKKEQDEENGSMETISLQDYEDVCTPVTQIRGSTPGAPIKESRKLAFPEDEDEDEDEGLKRSTTD